MYCQQLINCEINITNVKAPSEITYTNKRDEIKSFHRIPMISSVVFFPLGVLSEISNFYSGIFITFKKDPVL